MFFESRAARSSPDGNGDFSPFDLLDHSNWTQALLKPWATTAAPASAISESPARCSASPPVLLRSRSFTHRDLYTQCPAAESTSPSQHSSSSSFPPSSSASSSAPASLPAGSNRRCSTSQPALFSSTQARASSNGRLGGTHIGWEQSRYREFEESCRETSMWVRRLAIKRAR